ncbi:MAG: helix-turn-helix domain-containing protein [Deltaproteobacteria bacterium]|nr:helix-turn-helix domain-containing protein [Deltaproteobacteria bacterium]
MVKRLIGTSEAAKIMGISRVAVFKKIKKGEIVASKVGRNYVIDRRDLGDIYQDITPAAKIKIDKAVNRTVQEYGDVLKRLGKE